MLVLMLLLPVLVVSYPNPMLKPIECKHYGALYICDPDEVITNTARLNLNVKVLMLKTRTMNLLDTDPCYHGGVRTVVLFMKNASNAEMTELAREADGWTLDLVYAQCRDYFVIVCAKEPFPRCRPYTNHKRLSQEAILSRFDKLLPSKTNADFEKAIGTVLDNAENETI